jgi:hypothetical protein
VLPPGAPRNEGESDYRATLRVSPKKSPP